MSDAVRLSGASLPQMLAVNSADGRRMLVDLIGWLCMIPAAMQHGGHMTHEQTAHLLKRAAVRLSQSFFAERENELDSRWDGDIERAENCRNEAEEVRLLIEECRAAAALMTDDGNPFPLAGTPAGQQLTVESAFLGRLAEAGMAEAVWSGDGLQHVRPPARPPRSVTSGRRAGATLWSASPQTSTRPDEAP